MLVIFCIISAGDLDDLTESRKVNGTADEEDTVAPKMDFYYPKKALVEEVVAKEPDLSAQPRKPVLKKPGAAGKRKVIGRLTNNADGAEGVPLILSTARPAIVGRSVMLFSISSLK